MLFSSSLSSTVIVSSQIKTSRAKSTLASGLKVYSGAYPRLVVVDFSHPHYLKRIANVQDVLKEIGADSIPKIMVFNKIDQSAEAYAEFGNYFTPDLKNFFIIFIRIN